MEARKSSNAAQNICVYFVMLGVVSDIFLHYKTSKQNNELKQIIDEIKEEQIADRQKWMGSNQEGKFKSPLVEQNEFISERKLRSRVRKHVEDKILPIIRALDNLREYVLNMNNVDTSHGCKNATLVCRKGERGRRGKPGAQGMKGETGRKGEQGHPGAEGKRGSTGANGQKGQKGDAGPAGKSLEKPKFVTKFPKVVAKKEATNLSLVCEANGNPEPEIRWEFEPQKTDSRYTYPGKGAFFLTDINENDQGVIRCVAKNILGSNMIETKLDVHTKPEVTLSAAKQKAIEGTPVEMECNATGNPVPKMSWKRSIGKIKGQQYLSKDGRNLKLRFQRPTAADSGEYACEAVNYVGKAIRTCYLDVVVSLRRDCSAYKNRRKSGLYTINPDRKQPFKVFCDMATDGGGWTVIQRRDDGSVDFYKTWMEYKNGFGNLDNEFWLGNDKIHRLTKGRNMEIRFDLEDVDGNKAYEIYDLFYIDGEDEKYKVHVGPHSGNAGDSFSYHNGMKFTTKDSDNDIGSGNCAVSFHGAWWYKGCHYSNLNGKYLNGPHKSYANGVNWYAFKGYYNSMKKTEMKVRPMK